MFHLNRETRRAALWTISYALLTLMPADLCIAQSGTAYVGSQAFAGCHETQYASYQGRAKKARSYDSVKKMADHLTSSELHQCYECHTTGYGRPGGFRSERETPDLRNAGCEVCHGPGSRHVETTRAEDIRGKIVVADCEVCHHPERVEAFKFKPLIYGGGH